MTLIAADVASQPVEGAPLQIRAKRAGLPQKLLARIVGVSENTASLQLREKWGSGTPRYVLAAIVAWELMSHEQRMQWLDELQVDVITPRQTV